MGEACRGLSTELRARHPDPAWSRAEGLRNILVHHYFDLDEELIWLVVEQDLPAFRVLADTALRTLGGSQVDP